VSRTATCRSNSVRNSRNHRGWARAAFKVSHPLKWAELAVENQIVRSLRGQRSRSSLRQAPGAYRDDSAAPSDDGFRSFRVTWIPGTYEIPIAGLEYHDQAVQRTISAIRAGGQTDAVLFPEPDNPHDPNAIAVYTIAGQIGYVPRRIAAVVRPALVSMSARHGGRLAGCPAVVSVAGEKPRIVLMIKLRKLRVDQAALDRS
jgi:hypothetical protein